MPDGSTDQNSPEKLSLEEFLGVYKCGNVFAITTDQVTQAYVIWVESGEEVENDKFYTHPACDEAPVTEYMAFMIELRRLRFGRYEERRTSSLSL